MKGPLNHYIDWVIFPVLFAIISYFTANSLIWIFWCVTGFIAWTFLEYWTHRLFLHQIYWHANHQHHHSNPQDYIVFPLWYMPSLFLAAYLILKFTLPTLVWPLLAGFSLGYCWFLIWHHALHHLDLENKPWIKTYANWHNVHHEGYPANYGITTPIWDFVFRTYRPA
jgi:sterol desaturase/sphingolipid hydroxylase (fatty acid hydroxylase superfamily)